VLFHAKSSGSVLFIMFEFKVAFIAISFDDVFGRENADVGI
jgi:hypothetical protein